MVPILGIQGVIKMTKKEFSRMEENSPLYYNFSDEKFMFKRTWQVVFWGTRNYFRHPKTTCHSPEGSGGAPLRSRCAQKRKNRNKNWKNDRRNIQTASQEMTAIEKENELYSCFQSTATRISSFSDTVSRDLFSATVPPVHGARCIFAGL